MIFLRMNRNGLQLLRPIEDGPLTCDYSTIYGKAYACNEPGRDISHYQESRVCWPYNTTIVSPGIVHGDPVSEENQAGIARRQSSI